ncbi:MAG: peptide deformylase [Clostridia bacterium]|nr:peptide deformylase [Clostridia bacterium]
MDRQNRTLANSHGFLLMHDPLFLAQKSEPATEADRQIIVDLMDALRANLNRCVGMAANMIGEKKRIIVCCNGPMQMIMINPKVTAAAGEYEAEEGCLSLAGVRKTRRYRKITVSYQDQAFHARTGTFEGFTAQIIQHEIDHCDGILI